MALLNFGSLSIGTSLRDWFRKHLLFPQLEFSHPAVRSHVVAGAAGLTRAARPNLRRTEAIPLTVLTTALSVRKTARYAASSKGMYTLSTQ